MLNKRIVFYTDETKTLIDEERTSQYLEKSNKLFDYLLSSEHFMYEDLVSEVINEIADIYKYAFNLGCEYGKNVTEEAEELPKSVSAISGVKPKMFNEYEVMRIKQLKEIGFSNYQIAERYNCSEKTIRNYLKE